jgi:hypothetical protein
MMDFSFSMCCSALTRFCVCKCQIAIKLTRLNRPWNSQKYQLLPGHADRYTMDSVSKAQVVVVVYPDKLQLSMLRSCSKLQATHSPELLQTGSLWVFATKWSWEPGLMAVVRVRRVVHNNIFT